MARNLRLALMVSIIAFSAMRMWFVFSQPVARLDDQRELWPAGLAELDSKPGTTDVERQVFDPEAAVVMLVGDDLQPGVAGIDDDGNGVTDDRSELGASRSDDVCAVLTPSQLVSVDEQNPTLVLQYGAFVNVNSAEPRPDLPVQTRAILHGGDESPWSFVLE